MSARHAAPDTDRLGTVLAGTWLALHAVAVGLLGALVTAPNPNTTAAEAVPASVPDLPPPA